MSTKFDEEERLTLSKMLESWGIPRQEVDEYIDKKIKGEYTNFAYMHLYIYYYLLTYS